MDNDQELLPLPPLGLRSDVARLEEQLPWRARLVGWLMSYLPVLLMALLALATWWLVQQTPEPEVERARAPLRHEPDYEMRSFSIRHHSVAGPSAALIEGDHVRHYPDTDTLEIEQVRLRWRDPDGLQTVAVANRAVARADGSELTLEGDVQVQRGGAAGFEFHGQQLQVDARQQRMRSDRPIVLTQGRQRFEAGSVAYDHAQQLLELGGPVRGRAEPAAATP